jgi:2-octaprenylphenol hydroxylase
MSQILEFDIAIIGGGMVGTSLANMLAASQPQLRVALIEAQSFARAGELHYQPNFDARSTALSYGTATILRELGLWENLRTHATPIAQVHVSDRGHFSGGIIDAAENKLDAVGYVVENAWLGSVLLAHMQTQNIVKCFAPARVLQVTPQKNAARLRIQPADAEEFFIDASLVVVADGGESAVRKSLGIETQTREYGQTAIITNVEFSEPHLGVAFERFTDEGPIALLPLGESSHANRSALVWTLPDHKADEILAATDDEFLLQLQHRFGFRAGRFTRVAKRFAYPLRLVLAEEQIRSNIVLLGNAAHFLHPVAGQGFNLALRDCACLVETLGAALAKNHAPGDLSVLENYRAAQALDQQVTIEFSDKLVRLFSNDHLPLIALRHLGLLSLDFLPLLKDQFVAQTMGAAGRQFRWHMRANTQQDVPTQIDISSPQNSAVDSEFDLVIVGAGIVGAALACAIAQTESARNLRIAIIEAGGHVQEYRGDNFDPRVVALTHASENLLRTLDCWDAIERKRVCAYHEMKVWDGEGTASIAFDCAEVQKNHLGHIVENSVIVNQLRERIAQLSNIQVIQPAAVVDVNLPEAGELNVRIRLSNQRELSTRLLIAADGAQSQVRELACFQTREWDYGQDAIITTVRTEHPHEFTAWQRFMRTGPVAFLPLQNNGDAHQCSIVWSADSELAHELIALDDGAFCSRLEQAFEARLGKVLGCDKRYVIPLRQRHATRYIRPGVALVGDAAHSIHPLAGQGVNLGLQDVIALAGELERALKRGIPLGDESILRRYQRQRLAGNLGMMSAMEGFKHLFGNRSLGVNWIRNTGMRQLNSLPAIKKIIINAALGVN